MNDIRPEYHQTESQIQQDHALVRQAQQNIRHFAPLYDKYYVQVYRFVYQRIDSVDDVADIVSQTFLKAMQAIKKYELRSLPFASWLFQIAKNEVNLYFRKQKTTRTFYLNLKNEQELTCDIDAKELADHEVILKQLLENLEPDDLEIIEMRYFEKRCFKEVSEILSITESNAKVRVHRILQKLKGIAVQHKLTEIILTIALLSGFVLNI